MGSETKAEPLLAEFRVVITLPVQWGDQDAFGHVNNTVYFRWFESARIAYFARIGLSHALNADPIAPILASISCDYRRPITFPDTVQIGMPRQPNRADAASDSITRSSASNKPQSPPRDARRLSSSTTAPTSRIPSHQRFGRPSRPSKVARSLERTSTFVIYW